jgi:hypothetical protein
MRNIKWIAPNSIGVLLVVFASLCVSACSQTHEPQATVMALPEEAPVVAQLDESVGESAAATETPPSIEWLSPMLAVSLSGENRTSAYIGEPPIEVTVNDFGRENRGKIVSEAPADGQPLAPAQLTASELIENGAVKLTAHFDYQGDETHSIRFRFRIDQFQGHSVTAYGLGAGDKALVLWQDENGDWWNVRRTGWGGEFTGGTDTPGWFYPDTHATLSGTPYPVFTFDINKQNAGQFASQDFYLVFLEEVPFRRDEAGEATDQTSGYVVTYQAELPDGDGHFHGFKVLASASVYVHVPETERPEAQDEHAHEDDCDDDHGHHHH